MAQIEIPKPWRDKVCAILESDSPTQVQWTLTGQQRYESEGAITKLACGDVEVIRIEDAHRAFLSFLKSTKPTGCFVSMGPGDTYEFFFPIFCDKYYGKIKLRPDEKSVLILSAHAPEHDKLKCD